MEITKAAVSIAIQQQFKEMLDRGTIPIFEIELKDDEHLLIDLWCSDKGVLFEFDTNKLTTHFDGEIKNLTNGVYLLPYDMYFNKLDHYLEMIMQNLNEGYLLVHDLIS